MMSPEKSSLNEITRESLYERVWQTPAATLAAEWNISGPALAKRCKKLNVPVPPRGYWARLAAGAKLKKTPLPPSPEELVALALKEPIPTSVPADAPPHPISTLLLQSLLRAKPDREMRLSVKNVQLPQVIVTEAMIEPSVQSLEIIITALEKRGIRYRKARSKYDSAFFENGEDRLYLKIEEPLLVSHRKLTLSQRQKRGWSGELYAQEPTKELEFSIDTSTYLSRPLKTWTSDPVHPYRHTAALVVAGICDHFHELESKRAIKEAEEKKRAEERAERDRQREEEESEYRKQRRLREHRESLDKLAHERVMALLTAAEWWRLAETTTAYVRAMTERWRATGDGKLTPEQESWSRWALETARNMPPPESDFPNPTLDGDIDESAIPVGGPYPAHRRAPRPPSFPEIPPPQNNSGYHSTPSQPYPFWLKYRQR